MKKFHEITHFIYYLYFGWSERKKKDYLREKISILLLQKYFVKTNKIKSTPASDKKKQQYKPISLNNHKQALEQFLRQFFFSKYTWAQK